MEVHRHAAQSAMNLRSKLGQIPEMVAAASLK
jgi:hypothetical protein